MQQNMTQKVLGSPWPCSRIGNFSSVPSRMLRRLQAPRWHSHLPGQLPDMRLHVVTRQPSLALALHICALFHCLQWTCPVMPQTSVVQPKQCCRKPPRLSSVGFYPSETWETIWISSLYQEDMVILPPENTEGRKVPVSHPWKYG